MQRLTQFLHATLLAAAVVFLVTLTVFTVRIGRQVSAVLTEAQATGESVRLASENAKDFIAKQKAELEDPYHVKLRDAALQVGPAFVSVARSINTQTLPAAKSAIQSLEASSGQLRTLIANSDTQINGNVLPETTKTIAGIGLATRTASDAVSDLQSGANAALKSTDKAIQDLNTRINDSAITTTFTELAASATEIRKSTESLHYATVSVQESLGYMPETAKNIAKFSRNQTKISWAVGAVRLLRVWF